MGFTAFFSPFLIMQIYACGHTYRPKNVGFWSGLGRIDPGCDPNPGFSKIWADPSQTRPKNQQNLSLKFNENL